GSRLWFDSMFGAEGFNTTGTVRALPGGVVRFTGAVINSFSTLGHLENAGGTFEFDGTLNAAADLTGGDWVLMSGSQIKNSTLSTSAGGRLLIAPYTYGTYTDTEPTHFSNVSLESDLYFSSNSAADWSASAINGTMHFDSGTGNLVLFGGT